MRKSNPQGAKMHDCINCGGACYCSGDIEDHHVGDHDCNGCGCDEDEAQWADEYDDFTGPPVDSSSGPAKP